ncbi:MAG: hypothetical protein GXX98_14770 [Planctomycetes bacterium]|nr:hypothetical protein [Planctomycetota bacterium]
MKSDHRHELKTNELADWLAHFPQWVQENRTTLIGAGVVLVLVMAVYFVRFYRKDVVSVRHQVQLTGLVTQIPSQKMTVARSASQGVDQSIALLPIAQELKAFAEGSRNDRMAALAWIKHAETLRAELHYRPTGGGGEEVARQIVQAQNSYQEALTRASDVPALAATAQFGMGLCEEELGNFEQAKAIYQKVAQNAEYDGTAAQAAAANRLATVDDYRGAVAFKPAPAPKPESASTPQIQITPGGPNSTSDDVFFASPPEANAPASH